MKASGLVLLVIAAAAGAAFFYQSAQQPTNYFRAANEDTRFYNDTLVSMTEENRNLRKRVIALEQANQALREQLRTSTATQPTVDSGLEIPEPSALQTTAVTATTMAELSSATETSIEVRTYLEGIGASPATMQQDLSTKFNEEPVDYSWAVNHEQKIGQLFENQETLWEFVPEGITCKTTRCQIKVAAASFDESNRAMKALAEVLTNNAEGLDNAMLISAPNPVSGFVDFYIGRDKNVNLVR
jgi:hypothetical protein